MGEGDLPADSAMYYGGHTQADVKPTPDSPLLKLGIEHAPPLVTSAVLLDARTHMGGGDPLQPGQTITAADIDAMLEAQGLAERGILPGDVVYVYTGWSDNWNQPPYYAMGPGLGYDAARMLGEKGVVLVALDNPFTDPANDGQLMGRGGPARGHARGSALRDPPPQPHAVRRAQHPERQPGGARRGPGVGVLHDHPAVALRRRLRVRPCGRSRSADGPAGAVATPLDTALDPARRLLRTVFGYPAFRPDQEEIIRAVLRGRDALVLMPTGGGKSLCYQIPAMLRPGTGVVISPLIALMQDQVSALRQHGVAAAFLNSSLPYEEQQRIMAALRSGALDLLYLAPERLLHEDGGTLAMLRRIDISLIAIDEAHCVSQWGHDFRQDYLGLDVLGDHFPGTPRLALTATADEATRKEIVARLKLTGAERFISGFDRPNIRYTVRMKNGPGADLLAFLRERHGQAGIVYCLSRRKVEATAERLSQAGFDALPYHAGLSAQARRRCQERFQRSDGVIVVATIAFGMGIDKPDVRFVAHCDLPKSIEAYYQETGRAGRDGEPAEAWMTYGLQDVVRLRRMVDESEAAEDHKAGAANAPAVPGRLVRDHPLPARRPAGLLRRGIPGPLRQLRQLPESAQDLRRHRGSAEVPLLRGTRPSAFRGRPPD